MRTLIVGTLAYIFLIASLRIAGNRTLAKLNAFDLVVTVAFGSVFASILLSESVALAEGIAAIVLLCALQFSVAWLSVRYPRIAHLVRSEPVLLVREGQPLHGALHKARITKSELQTILRSDGHRDLSEVDAVVLETDGSFSVLVKPDEQSEGGSKDPI